MTKPTSPVRWPAVAAIYTGLTLLYIWPLLASPGSRLPADAGDPALNAWILWWNAHAVPFTSHWWNAPIFFPAPGALALSETLLSVSILTTPVQWLGANAVVAYNIAFTLSFFSAAVAAHALAQRLTGSQAAAFVAGIAFGFNPYRAAQLPHLQTLVSCWQPLALLALHRYVGVPMGATPSPRGHTARTRDLLLFGACWLLNGLTTGYFLVFFAVLLACWFVWFVRTRPQAIRILIAVVVATLPLAPLLAGYQHYQESYAISRTLTEIVFFSADLSAIWAASPYAWLPSHWTLEPRPEGELYPGVVILLLVIVGVVVSWPRRGAAGTWSRKRRRAQIALVAGGAVASLVAAVSWLWGGLQLSVAGLPISTTHPFKTVTIALWLFAGAAVLDRRFLDGWRRRSVLLFYVLAAVAMLAFALGPAGQAFGVRFLYQGPYAWLMHLPGGHALRVPARFGALMVLCLTQAAALSFARLTRNTDLGGRFTFFVKRPPRSFLLACGICALIALDGWPFPKLKTDPAPQTADLMPAAGRSIPLSRLASDTPVLELPMVDLYSDTAAMLRATVHRHPLINGYSGYAPPQYLVLLRGMRDRDPSTFEYFTDQQSVAVFVDRSRDEDGRVREFVRRIPGAALVADDARGSVWTVGRRAAEGPLAALPALPRSQSVTIHGGTGAADLLFDDDLTSAWHERPDDSTPPEIEFRFDRPVTISVLQIDVGANAPDYPAQIRVEQETAGSSPSTVWEGGLAGAALRAAFTDFRRTRLQIRLPDSSPAETWKITILPGNEPHYWQIAELRIFGR